MKFKSALIIPLLVVLWTLASGQTFSGKRPNAPVARASKREGKEPDQQVERKLAADPNVSVRVCVQSGSITVHGWDKNEVRARSTDVAEIELQHDSEPAKKIQLLIADKAQGPGRTTSCLSFSDVELNVPRGATVQLQTRDGDIRTSDVATAYVNTQNGDVSIERASKAVDAGTIGGVISVRNSSGSINLHSVGGNIEVNDVRSSEASDTFDASSVAGDITLDRVAHTRVTARSLNGSLSMSGQLTHGGHYGFTTNSGDVTLALPANSSFKISAKLSRNAEMITDFPITLMSYASAPLTRLPKKDAPSPVPAPATAKPAPATAKPAPVSQPEPASTPSAQEPDGDGPQVMPRVKVKIPRVIAVERYALRRIEGVCGGGDASIDVGSFSGTVHLKKQ